MIPRFHFIGCRWMPVAGVIWALASIEAQANRYEYELDNGSSLQIETAAEFDLNSSQVNSDITWGEDANANNHNVFAIGGNFYVYTYTYGYKHELRVVDTSNPGYFRTIHSDLALLIDGDRTDVFKGKTNFTHTVVNDDEGNICLVSIYFNQSVDSDSPINLKIGVCAFKDLEEAPGDYKITYYENEVKGLHSFFDRVMSPFEINHIQGNAYTGEFDLEISGLHNYRELAENHNLFYVGKLNFGFSNGKLSYKNYTFFESTDLGDFSDYTAPSSERQNAFFSITRVTDDIHIVQRHKKTAPLLFMDGGKGKTGPSQLADFPCCEQVDKLDAFAPETDEENPSTVLDGRYGVKTFTVDDETFLLTTKRTYSAQGPKFVLFHWKGNKSTFAGLTKVCEFPEDGEYVVPSKIYSYARPKVSISRIKPSGASSAKRVGGNDNLRICTYVPGSALGVYNLAASNEGDITSGVESISNDGEDGCDIFVNGKQVDFRWNGTSPKDLTAQIFSIDGKRVCQFRGSQVTSGINLNMLSPGIYILRLNNQAKQIRIR